MYVVIGGFGGFGLVVVCWLVDCGVGWVVLGGCSDFIDE